MTKKIPRILGHLSHLDICQLVAWQHVLSARGALPVNGAIKIRLCVTPMYIYREKTALGFVFMHTHKLETDVHNSAKV